MGFSLFVTKIFRLILLLFNLALETCLLDLKLFPFKTKSWSFFGQSSFLTCEIVIQFLFERSMLLREGLNFSHERCNVSIELCCAKAQTWDVFMLAAAYHSLLKFSTIFSDYVVNIFLYLEFLCGFEICSNYLFTSKIFYSLLKSIVFSDDFNHISY